LGLERPRRSERSRPETTAAPAARVIDPTRWAWLAQAARSVAHGRLEDAGPQPVCVDPPLLAACGVDAHRRDDHAPIGQPLPPGADAHDPWPSPLSIANNAK